MSAVRANSGADEFDGWYRALAPRVVAALVVICGDPETAADASAEAFARAFERWRRVAPMDQRDAWVLRVAKNVVYRQARRSALERRHAPRWSDRPVEVVDVSIELRNALRELTARQREAIALRYVADLSQREIAAAMGIADGTAAATLAQARKRLAQILEREPDITEEVER